MADKEVPAVEALLPVELGAGKVKFAQGMKAGRWVFVTGLMAQDFKSGIASDVLSDARRTPDCPNARRKRSSSRPRRGAARRRHQPRQPGPH